MTRAPLHPLVVRLWHWANAAGCVALLLTGVRLRYGFWPGGMLFGTALRWHGWIGLAVAANWFVWAGFYLTSPRIRCYLPRGGPAGFCRNAAKQVRHYAWGMFRGEPDPHRPVPLDKFNPPQLALYLLVMLGALPLQAASGILLWRPVFFARQIAALGGLRVVDTLHVALFAFFIGFILLHAYLGTLGRPCFGQYRAMITGGAEQPDQEGKDA